MKELTTTRPDPVTPQHEETRQAIKEKQALGRYKIPPGCKLFEMVCVRENGELSPGMSENGDFDPELAIVRPVSYETNAATFGEPAKNEIGMEGPIQRGIVRKAIITDGNILIVAMNEATARSKIIKKFFPC